MKDTYSLTRKRSDFLKKVDEAVKAYDLAKTPTARQGIKTALDRWRFEQSKEGKKWTDSVRNKKGAVTNLHRAVNDLDKRKLSKEELEALQYIARMQAMALQRQFAGAQVQFKSSTLLGMANQTSSNWQRFKTGASSVQSGGSTAKSIYTGAKNIQTGAQLFGQQGLTGVQSASKAGMSANFLTIKQHITEFCRTLCPDVDPNTIFAALHLGGVEQFAVELAPFVGAISSGGKAIIGWIGVAKKSWDGIKLADRRYAISPGDPEAAFDALLILVDREIASAVAKASVKTGAFTGKTLGVFCDGGAVTGPVVGLLEVLAEIFQTIIEYVRDYKEVKAANEALHLGALNLEIFEVCPTLGCYFLVVQDHSTIINFAVGDYGTENWMFDVERLIKKIDPVLLKAKHYIQISRFEVPGMSQSKGVVEENYSVKTGFSKVTGLPEHVKGKIADRIASWVSKPEKPPKVDKSRITGFGSG